MLLPEHNQLKQILITRNLVLQKFGGLIFTRQKKRDYKGAIERVLFEPEFTEQAQKFAQKYKDFDPSKQLNEIADRCEKIKS